MIKWSFEKIAEIYEQPFLDLIHKAHEVHLLNHEANKVQMSNLLSIKTGACPEDCGYCTQSGHYKTSLKKEKLLPIDKIIEVAKKAKAEGATRFCMGAAWRSPPDKELDNLTNMIAEVKKLGLETCMTLGMLSSDQAKKLKEAGLDYYNHNIDTSPSFYEEVITTRTFQDRLDTLKLVHESGINVCCGGIMGLGESRNDRIEFLLTLANLNPAPKSVPINRLVAMKGTPLENAKPIEGIELTRVIATARILMPKSFVRLSAGRTEMSDELQALCFYAGCNSIFMGEKLLTTDNPNISTDQILFNKLGIEPLLHVN